MDEQDRSEQYWRNFERMWPIGAGADAPAEPVIEPEPAEAEPVIGPEPAFSYEPEIKPEPESGPEPAGLPDNAEDLMQLILRALRESA